MLMFLSLSPAKSRQSQFVLQRSCLQKPRSKLEINRFVMSLYQSSKALC